MINFLTLFTVFVSFITDTSRIVCMTISRMNFSCKVFVVCIRYSLFSVEIKKSYRHFITLHFFHIMGKFSEINLNETHRYRAAKCEILKKVQMLTVIGSSTTWTTGTGTTPSTTSGWLQVARCNHT